jgi:hypothetical protein
MWWAGLVARIGEKITHIYLKGRLKEREHFEDAGLDGSII